jgi:hypothetical protein
MMQSGSIFPRRVKSLKNLVISSIVGDLHLSIPEAETVEIPEQELILRREFCDRIVSRNDFKSKVSLSCKAAATMCVG